MNPLNEKDFHAIKAHAEYEAPFECCGVITVNGVIRCTNVAKDRKVNATIDSRELQRIHKRTPITGFYHSHVNGPAMPSNEDLDAILYSGIGYVIASVSMRAGGKATEMAGFEMQTNSKTGRKLVRQWAVTIDQ